MKHSTLFQPRIIRIVEIVFLSLFIFSLFIPYVYGVRPKEYLWDIFGNNIFNEGWSWIVIVSFPLILSFILFILKIGKLKFGILTLKLLKWVITIIYAFVLAIFVINTVSDDLNNSLDSLLVIPIIFTIVLSLFLYLITLYKAKDNYIIIENYILAIITIPVAYFFIGFLEFEFGGYLLNICFAVLYVIAVLKVFLLKKIEKNPTA